ncbi:MAG TPA: glycosyltransferase family 2 protein [Victivallales bacterium]|nr:glycosyltransferase family 2 protein [Victivallales bacterium]
MIEISVIIPIKDEEENILVLADEIEMSVSSLGRKWECIWIDDGSIDKSFEKLKLLEKKENSVHRVFQHEKCFGQSAALASGFALARGKIFVTLDGDGQNDPSCIPDLVKKLIEENADVVNGWREKRHDNVIRKLSSRIANGSRNFFTGEKIRDVGCALRVMRKECVEKISVFKGMHRFLPTLIRIAGYEKIFELPVKHRPRERGKTKYGVWNRLWVGIADTMAVCWMKKRLVFPKLKKNLK